MKLHQNQNKQIILTIGMNEGAAMIEIKEISHPDTKDITKVIHRDKMIIITQIPTDSIIGIISETMDRISLSNQVMITQGITK